MPSHRPHQPRQPHYLKTRTLSPSGPFSSHSHSPTLLNLTPYLLLQIISHLPSTTSFHTLTQTCKTLHSFFRTHASTICNTHIRLHYSLEATLLQSVFVEGEGGRWLLPTSPAVSGRSRNSLVESGGFLSQEDINHSEGNGIKEEVFNLSHILALENVLTLSRPGPHYLHFLEKTSLEIKTRASMFVSSMPPFPFPLPDNNSKPSISEAVHMATETQRNQRTGRIDEKGLLEKVRREVARDEKFIDELGFFVVRVWEGKVGGFVEGYGEYLSALEEGDDEDENVEKEKEEKISDPRGIKKSVTRRLKSVRKWSVRTIKRATAWRGVKNGFHYYSDDEDGDSVIEEKSGLLFGEIERTEDTERKLEVEEEKLNFSKGLLWYYGRNGVNPSVGRSGRVFEKVPLTNGQIYMKGINRTARRVGGSLRRAWRRCRCAGEDERWDD